MVGEWTVWGAVTPLPDTGFHLVFFCASLISGPQTSFPGKCVFFFFKLWAKGAAETDSTSSYLEDQ